jgi:hypothetical protein
VKALLTLQKVGHKVYTIAELKLSEVPR